MIFMRGQDLGELAYLIIIVPILISLVVVVFNSIQQTTCQQYIQTIDQKNKDIDALNGQLNTTQSELNEWKQKYQALLAENITKQDIREIEYSLNTTQNQVNLINEKIDTVNNQFITVYNNLFFYFSISIVFNLFLIFFVLGDLVSIAFFNVDVKTKVIKWIARRVKKFFKKEERDVKG